jgi:hypothetical protein
MPTFTTTTIMSSQSSNLSLHKLKINPKTQSNIVTIDGWIFQTTDQTLTQADLKSLLSQLSKLNQLVPYFINRDPDLFFILLSLLRIENLPSKAKFSVKSQSFTRLKRLVFCDSVFMLQMIWNKRINLIAATLILIY